MELMPRPQEGIAPQRLLTVLLGDYWFARTEPIPSSALVELLGLFGFSATSARAAVQRLARRGFLVAHRNGRQTSYAVHAKSQEALAGHVRRLFHAHRPEAWDGTWTLALYSLGASSPTQRRQLREQLRERHFGQLHDGVWLRPGRHAQEVLPIAQRYQSAAVDQFTVMEGAGLPGDLSPRSLRTVFDADARDESYMAFTRDCEQQRSLLRRSVISGPAALLLRTSVMSEWRALVREDPLLPREMLNSPSPIALAADACASVYDNLGPQAEHVVRRVLERHESNLAHLVTHHTFAERQPK